MHAFTWRCYVTSTWNTKSQGTVHKLKTLTVSRRRHTRNPVVARKSKQVRGGCDHRVLLGCRKYFFISTNAPACPSLACHQSSSYWITWTSLFLLQVHVLFPCSYHHESSPAQPPRCGLWASDYVTPGQALSAGQVFFFFSLRVPWNMAATRPWTCRKQRGWGQKPVPVGQPRRPGFDRGQGGGCDKCVDWRTE